MADLEPGQAGYDPFNDPRRRQPPPTKTLAAQHNSAALPYGTTGITDEPPDLHEDFWQAREELTTIRQFAWARRVSPLAALGSVLLKVTACTPPQYVLPPLRGGVASLNQFVAVCSASGGGKSTAEAAADDMLIPGFPSGAEGRQPDTFPLGSAEGIAALFVDWQKIDHDKAGRYVQHRTTAIISISEVDTLAAFSSRQGSPLQATLRDVWMAAKIGQHNAAPERRRVVPSHAYRACVTVGVQDARAGVLLDAADGGTPQRFLWMPATSRHRPTVLPDTPEPIRWTAPPATNTRIIFDVCTDIETAVDKAINDALDGVTDPLDAHAVLCREKVAASLALLDGTRTNISQEDWQLAGVLMAISRSERDRIVRVLADAAEHANTAAGRRQGKRQIAASEVMEAAAIRRITPLVLARLADDQWWPRKKLRAAISNKLREHLDAALTKLVQTGQIERRNGERGGTEYRQVTRQ